jgi:hypothetical protein
MAEPSEKLVIELDSAEPDKTINLGKKTDFKKEVLKKLGDYVADITKYNQYQLKPGSTIITNKDASGNPMIIPASELGAQHTSLDDSAKYDPDIATNFDKISNSGQLDTDTAFQIKKGKEASTAQSGQQLFDNVNLKKDQSDFTKRVQQVLLDNNRFNADQPYITEGSAPKEEEAGTKEYPVQTVFGEHSPRKFPTATQNQTSIKVKELKKMGLMMMLQASGEAVIPQDPTSVEAEASVLIPGLARLGQKVAVSRFDANYSYSQIDPAYTHPLLPSLKQNTLTSYGSPYNYLVQFSGLTATPSILTATLLLTTCTALIKGVALLLGKQTTATSRTISPNIPANTRKYLGSYLGNNTSRATSLLPTELNLNIIETRNNYLDCISWGINTFFGIGGNPTSLGSSIVAALGQGSLQSMRIHGYYNTVLRNIIRSVRDVIVPGTESALNILSDGSMGAAPSAFNIEKPTSTFTDPLSAIQMLDRLNSSALVKFLNILASIGDIIIDNANSDFNYDTTVSLIDQIEEVINEDTGHLDPSITHVKSRLSDGSLAWKQNSVASLYYFPMSAIIAAENMPNEGTSISSIKGKLQAGNNTTITDSTFAEHGRIKAEHVKKLEDELEKDYMPFYLHDLRTNEIISFHAFIDSIQDNFNAEYEETTGYGRIGDVPIYKNTKRTISLSFMMAALDEQDFDLMWYKINKLVTLVYPQWTEGRRLNLGDPNNPNSTRFVQPFSQVPSASPLIRLRLGDMFKSNYSKFAVARLFGLSNDDTKFKLTNVSRDQSGRLQTNSNAASEQAARVNAAINSLMHDREFGTGFIAGEMVDIDNNVVLSKESSQLQTPRQPAGSGGQRPTGTPGGTRPTGRGGNRPRNNNNQLRGPFGPAKILPSSEGTTMVPIGDETFYYVTFNGLNQEGTWKVNINNVHPNAEWINNRAQQSVNNQSSAQQTTNASSVDASNTISNIAAFFNDNDNPILKAFNSTKGKGLAGFIKSLQFDYAQSTWETQKLNSRAPIFLKINVEFTPIYDIAPGLDSDGFMTAPIYNVGQTMKYMGSSKDQKDLDEPFNTSRANITNIFDK